MTKEIKKELVDFKNWLNENHSGMYMKISNYELDKYCKEQLNLPVVSIHVCECQESTEINKINDKWICTKCNKPIHQ